MIQTLERPTRPQTLMCIHASATSGRAWQAFTAPLRERFTVVTPDRLGPVAGTAWAVGAATSFDAEARHLEPLPGDARSADVHLVGHSFGGAVAMQLALRHPHRIRSLTLYEPTRFAWLRDRAETTEAAAEIGAVGHAIGDAVVAGRHRAAAQRFVDYWSGDGCWAAMDERRQQSIVVHMPKVKAEFEAAFADVTPMAVLRSLTMPVRLLTGTASPRPVRQICETLAALLPVCDMVTLAGIGHMGPLTHPERVRAALPDVLQRRPAILTT